MHDEWSSRVLKNNCQVMQIFFDGFRRAVEIYWDGKLRAEYRQEKLAEYDCRWNDKEQRPQSIDKPKHFETTFSSRQRELFEVSWLREPIEEIRAERKSAGPVYSEQLKLPFSKAA